MRWKKSPKLKWEESSYTGEKVHETVYRSSQIGRIEFAVMKEKSKYQLLVGWSPRSSGSSYEMGGNEEVEWLVFGSYPSIKLAKDTAQSVVTFYEGTTSIIVERLTGKKITPKEWLRGW